MLLLLLGMVLLSFSLRSTTACIIIAYLNHNTVEHDIKCYSFGQDARSREKKDHSMPQDFQAGRSLPGR